MGKKILLVDDEPQNLRFIELALATTGYQMLKAMNGQEAMEQVLQARPHLVITDMFMPRMNGIQLLKEIRKKNPHLPVIGITGGHFDHEDEEINTLGFALVLKKPVDTELLIRTVKKLIG